MPGLPYLGAAELAALSWTTAIDALQEAFRREDIDALPGREHVHVPGGELLLMPAHGAAGVGVKLVTLNHDNPARGLPLIHGAYVLFDPVTLAPEALVDAAALTALRTAAVSALATRHLARADASRLVVFGAGVQGAAHVEAICAERPIDDIGIVRTRSDRAQRLVERLCATGLPARLVEAGAVAQADIVCTCTTSTAALFPACAVREGTHVNAIGAYRPDMRELAGELLARARVTVETRTSALHEAGDIIQAVREGHVTPAALGELADVVDRASPRDGEVTVFKSVGLAFEDLVLARAAARVSHIGALDGTRAAL